MNILFINSIQMFGGGEVWLFRMMRALSSRGHRLYLLCRPGVPLEIKARDEGFNVFTVRMRGDLDPISIFYTYRLIRKIRAQVVCTNMDKELRFGGLAARIAGVKAVIPRRGIDYPLKNTWAYRWSYTRLAHGIIANSNSTRQALLRNSPWLNPDHIQVIYNGVDPSRFSGQSDGFLRKTLSIHENAVILGFVGQLDERKGVESLIRAFCRVALKNNSVHLMLVGEGPLKTRLEKISGKFRNRVHFTGFRNDIENFMKTIDVLVLPSLWEGFGIVLIEAMAAGKPVITTKISNMPEIVSHLKDGLLVPPSDDSALADAMMLLIKNQAMRKKMGIRGRQKVMRQFTLKRMADETEAYFMKFLSGTE